ncbi:cytochrome o ubiquinol oxidase subunit I [Lichenicola cladoniae]|uniref:Cytochrome o ubiquinol oxidase subunit I n=1 Tax=Lichenicola cladoniae TaxID=1484109 RepID=A0A6M8HF62_9PROT|nr:cytochrome o ubiquinol oxidase subunit I [Lichenicola cladoniae]NPD68570.1 cytochrome o ubiquinol oxidase subunit I [Acetobacteraceae bacterium]QKE88950.1 cytochrome o ubiquinol oxidase subunit I [Lichenicola cladoniae]
MLGKLTLSDVPYDQPIIMGAAVFMGLLVAAVLAAITWFRQWRYLWTEWITSVDHKRIGVMYIIVAILMLVRGFSDAIMMRMQQAMAHDGAPGFLPPHHYDQIFTAHGTIMIFFMAMPFMIGLMNVAMPLQIGARDVAFPFLNSLSFWLTAAGAILVNVSLVIGEFGQVGWLAYPPLSELKFSPGVGVDYYLWSLQLTGLGTLLTGVNFFVTIVKMRAPGMTWMRMPVFTWTTFCSVILILATFPILTATFAMLALDRYLGMHFFTNDLGGNPMMYVNLIWAWGHPEVYILVLPAFGIYSEIVPTFSRKRLFGYKAMVYATISITVLSLIVWLHHFFTMGSGANVNAFFGITTMMIAIPTGVKIFNWLFTMYRGSIRYNSMMLWVLGFMVTFTIGGMTGVMLAIPASDFVLHNSLFLIAHFHNVIIGGVVFGYLAGLTYWFPKVFGFKLHEGWGKATFWCWLIGFTVAFMPLYALGFMGMTRRMNHYDNPAWTPYLQVALVGAVIVACGILCTVIGLVVSIIERNSNLDITGDPWDGRTLEWSTSSPPPFYNFAVLPRISGLDAFNEVKKRGLEARETPVYADIHMPRNTPAGFIIGVLLGFTGFGLVWNIWWMVALTLFAAIATFIVRSCNDDIGYIVPKAEVARIERRHRLRVMALAPVGE